MIREIARRLNAVYDKGESRAIAQIIAEEATGMRLEKILSGALRLEDFPRAIEMTERALRSEPIQHIIGWTMFCGHKIKCDRRALVPRPETEEMVEWIMNREEKWLKVLDIGTGSGCIAAAFASAYEVTAIEKSDEAIELARENFSANNVNVRIVKDDILCPAFSDEMYDIIVSNPPYIRPSERFCMEENVLKYEPEMALFAEEERPLMFYEAIAEYGIKHLIPGGRFYVEVNSALGEETAEVFRHYIYNNVSIRKDMFGNNRVVYGIKPI